MTNSNKIKYTECYVAFIDILGMKYLVDKSKEDLAILETLVKILNHFSNVTGAYHAQSITDKSGSKTGEDEYLVQTHAFSDCIVFFVPVESNGLSTILNSVRYVFDRAIELDCIVRGAVTVGRMYYEESWGKCIPDQFKQIKAVIENKFNINNSAQLQKQQDDDILYDHNKFGLPITLGPAMIEAYQLEQECVVYPRVMLTEKLVVHIKGDENVNNKTFLLISPEPNIPSQRLLDFVFSDFDGVHCFDVLHENLYRNETERIIQEELENGKILFKWERRKIIHKDIMSLVKTNIEKKLGENLPVKEMIKYQWLKNYYNCKCGEDARIS